MTVASLTSLNNSIHWLAFVPPNFLSCAGKLFAEYRAEFFGEFLLQQGRAKENLLQRFREEIGVHLLRLIQIGLLTLIMSFGVACSGGGGSAQDPFNDGGNVGGGAPLEDVGESVNSQSPGTAIMYTYSDNYDLAIQIGVPVHVRDTFTSDDSYEVLNPLTF